MCADGTGHRDAVLCERNSVRGSDRLLSRELKRLQDSRYQSGLHAGGDEAAALALAAQLCHLQRLEPLLRSLPVLRGGSFWLRLAGGSFWLRRLAGSLGGRRGRRGRSLGDGSAALLRLPLAGRGLGGPFLLGSGDTDGLSGALRPVAPRWRGTGGGRLGGGGIASCGGQRGGERLHLGDARGWRGVRGEGCVVRGEW